MGVVYRARQQTLDRLVALKLLLGGVYSSEAMLQRFQVEAAAAAALRHPGIVTIHDYGEFEGQPFYTMELIEGRNLAQVSDGRPLEPKRAALYLREIAEAVGYAHGRSILHRDLKPSNILVDRDDRAHVADFGMAKRLDLDSSMTLTGQAVGSPNYAAPEQVSGHENGVGVTTDIYSLGALLYHLLLGRPPFLSSTLEETLRLLLTTEPVAPRLVNPSVPRDLETICLKCLAMDPSQRFASAAALVDDLDRFLGDRPILARPAGAFYRVRKFTRRHKLGVAALASVIASLGLGLVASSVLLSREREAHARTLAAEQKEGELRHEAEKARELESKRSSRSALDLAEQLLQKGDVAKALAYFVHAARKDPGNSSIAPLLASIITAHNFLLPEAVPYQCGSRVLALRYTNDGRSIYIGTEDGMFRVLDSASGKRLREVRLGKMVARNGWAFPKGSDSVFAVLFVDRTVGLYDSRTGLPVWPTTGIGTTVLADASVSLSPDGRWLCLRGSSVFWVWNARTGQLRTKQTFPKFVFGPAFRADGAQLAFVSEDTVHVWSLPECQPSFAPISIRRKLVPDVELLPEYSDDGRFLAILDLWEDAHVFNASNGSLVVSHPNPPLFTGFLPDGRLLAYDDRSWNLLDPETGKTERVPLTEKFSGDWTSSTDGRFLVTASDDGSVRLWETKTGQSVAVATAHQGGEFHAVPSPDGSHVVIGTGTGAILRLRVERGFARPLTLRRFAFPQVFTAPFSEQQPTQVLWFKAERAAVLDVASGREVPGGFAYPRSDLSILQSPSTWIHVRDDLKYFVVRDWTGRRPSIIWERSKAGVRRVGDFQADKGTPPGAAQLVFSRSGDLVARARSIPGKPENCLLGVWDLATGTLVGPGCFYDKAALNSYSGIDFSLDGKFLTGTASDGNILIWEARSGRVAKMFSPGSEEPFTYAQLSPDGTRILTGRAQEGVRLWNVTTGSPINPVLLGSDAGTFSQDGRWYFTGNTFLMRIWNAKDGAPVGEINTSGAGEVKFSHDSERITVPDGDGQVRVFDVQSGQPLTDHLRLNATVFQTSWSMDDRFLEVTGGDAGFHIFSVPPPLPKGTPIPQWILQLASACAMQRVTETEACVDDADAAAEIADVRRQLASMPDDAPLVAWGRWLLNEDPDRPIAPGFGVTPARAAELKAGGEGAAGRPQEASPTAPTGNPAETLRQAAPASN
jgi:WD40 repeat protein